MDASELLREYKNGRRDFRGVELRGKNLSKAGTREAHGGNLSNANLANACLHSMDLSEVNLSNANLSNANLFTANLTNANLSNANLFAANLTNANLSEANLTSAKLQGANLTSAELQGADLTNANLEGADLSFFRIESDAGNIDLPAAQLREANLQNVNLRGANLQNAQFQGANLKYADLRGADRRGADLENAIFEATNSVETAETRPQAREASAPLSEPQNANRDPNKQAGDVAKRPQSEDWGCSVALISAPFLILVCLGGGMHLMEALILALVGSSVLQAIVDKLSQTIGEDPQAKRKKKLQKDALDLRTSEKLRLAESLSLGVDELRRLTPYEFEDRIAEMFERLGYSVQQTPSSGDHGYDAIAKKDGQTYLIECKRFQPTGTIGRRDLQVFRSAVTDTNAKKGYFVTTGRITSAASDYVKDKPIELIDPQGLQKLIYEAYPDGGSDQYEVLCESCGARVKHSLRSPADKRCTCGAMVSPSLSLNDVLAVPSFSSFSYREGSARRNRRRRRW